MSINLDEKIDYALKNVWSQKDWLSPVDLENEYGISKSTQGKFRMSSNASTIPFSKVGKYIRYNRNAINKWLEEHQVQ